MKFNKSIIIVLVLALVMKLFMQNTMGNIVGFPVQTNISDSKFANFFSRMTKLGPELRCNPGSPDGFINQAGKSVPAGTKGAIRVVNSSYYTGGLLPGGYCNDQEVVGEAINYKLNDDTTMLGD